MVLSHKYKTAAIDRANRWIVKALDVLQEARVLSETGQTRAGAYSRLYYSAHHAAVALLSLIGISAKKHDAIRNQFGKLWVKGRKFPRFYGRLLNDLYSERAKADYGEYVPTMVADVEARVDQVERLIRRAQREIPPVSTEQVLKMLADENSDIETFRSISIAQRRIITTLALLLGVRRAVCRRLGSRSFSAKRRRC